MTNIYHPAGPENTLIIFTFRPDGSHFQGNYYVFLFTEILKTKFGPQATYVNVYCYYCTVISYTHCTIRTIISSGFILFFQSGVGSELSLSKKSHYNDEMILLTNLIS